VYPYSGKSLIRLAVIRRQYKFELVKEIRDRVIKHKENSMISRKDFIKGALSGVGATAAMLGGIKIATGDLGYLFAPLDGLSTKLRPKIQEEMVVILLGTGMPLSGINRSKPANVILAGDKIFLVDCGEGAVRRLIMAGIPPSRISDVLFTHHHSDHNSGFDDFMVSSWTGGKREQGRQIPLQVYGPTNTKQIIEKFMDAWKWDLDLRANHTGVSIEGIQVNYHEKNDGVIYDDQGIKVTSFTVDHGTVKPAIGYRFEYKDKVIVISGDTLPTENMIIQSETADILVHEAYSMKWLERGLKNNPSLEKIITNIVNYHSSTMEVAEIAKKARVKHLVFTHLMPDPSPLWYFEKDWARSVSDIYDGNITVGRDLMEV